MDWKREVLGEDEYVDERTPFTAAGQKSVGHYGGPRDGDGRHHLDPHLGHNHPRNAELRKYNFAIKVRHSRWYFIFNIFVLLLTTFLVAWVVQDKGHNPRSRLFFLIETFVTFAVVGDVILEINYDGWRAYFFVDRAASESRQGHKNASNTLQYLKCVGNWFQFTVMVLCVCALLVYALEPDIPGVNSGPEGDTLFSFSLLLVRYTLYVFFILISSGKTLQMRGCCDNKKDWEIPDVEFFEDEDGI